ncbi:MAG TPA: hypothetical protein VLJ59_09775 [Mycobacteriales bacterium]|nr:hypothetical protein [Mycobacteriales bacterium]
MANVVRAVIGGPDAASPYVDAPPGGVPASVGITTGDTVAVRVEAQPGAPLEARVTAGQGRVTVGASAAEAAGNAATVPAGSGLLYLRGAAATLSDESSDAHVPCNVEVWQASSLVARITPRVRDSLPVAVRIWQCSVSPVDPDAFDPDADPGPYQGITVHGAELDTARVLNDVAAYWRPAGIEVRAAATKPLQTMNLLVKADQDLRTATEAGLKRHKAFQDTLRGSATERVVNIVLVSAFERMGLTYAAWGRDESNADGAAVAKDLKGFAGPLAIVAVNGSLTQEWAWMSRSTDTSAFVPPLAATPAAPAARDFHYLGLGSDVAHELGHTLGLAHTPEPGTQDPLHPYYLTMLMHPRVFIDQSEWGKPGYPVTSRGSVAGSEHAAALAGAVGPTRVRPVPAQTSSVRVEQITKAAPNGSPVALVFRAQTQWLTLRGPMVKSTDSGQRQATLDVDPFMPRGPYPLGSSGLFLPTTAQMFVKGGLLPSARAAQARQHILSGHAFGE